MTDLADRRRTWIPLVAGLTFAVSLCAVLGAGVRFAVRDSRAATLAAAELTEKPVTELQGSSFDTTYSTYSVQPPAIVDAVQSGMIAPVPSEDTTSGPATKPPSTNRTDDRGFLRVSFRELAGFDYGISGTTAVDASTTASAARKQTIPPAVQELTGKNVTVTGYMMPIEFQEGRVRSFLLMRNQLLCCFGIAPRLNDFVAVQVADPKGIPAVNDIPISASGTLQVGEVLNNGIPLALYTMIAVDVRTGRK